MPQKLSGPKQIEKFILHIFIKYGPCLYKICNSIYEPLISLLIRCKIVQKRYRLT